MNLFTIPKFEKRQKADLLVIPYWETKRAPTSASSLPQTVKQQLKIPLQSGDFTGKEGEILIHYISSKKEERIALIGLGNPSEMTEERWRRALSKLVFLCQKKQFKTLNLFLPEKQLNLRALLEGLFLPNYHFSYDEKKRPVLIERVSLIGAKPKEFTEAKRLINLFEGVYLARDLVNGNADLITPQYLGLVAKKWAKELSHVKATVWGRREIEKNKMGLLLAVSRGSVQDPAFIMMNYRGKSSSKEHTVIIGKGVTYDTGGLNMKRSMESMKCDMAGAAAALGTLVAIAKMGLNVNVSIVIPTTENSVGAHSYKPGDVYCAYDGTTVEIGNTDAEGRLILADAISYTAAHLKPTRIIDLATLTGAVVLALGSEASGLMSNDDTLAKALKEAGDATFERVHRLPIYPEWQELLKSDIADLKNIGMNGAKSSVAAIFLQHFVGDIPWAHLDIAGTAYLLKQQRYLKKYATGYGVRLLVHFLEQLSYG